MENSNSGKVNTASQRPEQLLDAREFFDFLWRIRFLILGSVAVALCVAFFIVRMQEPVYQRATWVMLNKNDGSNANIALMNSVNGVSTSKKVDNESFIITSPTIMAHVVEDLGLNSRYYHYTLPIFDRLKVGRSVMGIKKSEYYLDNPFTLTSGVDSLYASDFRPKTISVKFQNIDGKTFNIREISVNGVPLDKLVDKDCLYGEKYAVPGGFFTIDVKAPEHMIAGDNYLANQVTPQIAAKSFCANLSASVYNGSGMAKTDIVIVSMRDNKPARAENILNAVIEEVNRSGREYANLVSLNTVEFLNQRLEELSSELNSVETDFQQYQADNVVLNLSSQSQMAMSSDMEYQNQLINVQTQIKILDMISDYLKGISSDSYKVIPSDIGISDAGLNGVISSYNATVAERNRLLANASENNPRVITMNAQLEECKKAIEVSIANLYNVYRIRESELSNTLSVSRRKMSSIPVQQYKVQQLTRKVSILEPLYLLLQQKREEAQISMYSQDDTFRVLERAFGNSGPVKPQPMLAYLIALIIGICLPPGFLLLRSVLRTKVETKDDVRKRVDAEILAVIPYVRDLGNGLLPARGHEVSNESFRMLRSNLQYLPNAKVLQVSSSLPGEGKSFVSANLAISLTLAGKSVLLMGMDIRKPMLGKLFGNKTEKHQNLVSYLIGKADKPENLVVHSAEYPGLDIIFAGPVPPNPSELLSQGRHTEVINALKDKYDYVIIDSAPYLIVTDSALINKCVDATLLVVRVGETDLRVLSDLNDEVVKESNPIKNPKIVMNGLSLGDKKYQYGYGRSYTYGYGYGYGYGTHHRHNRGYGYGYGYGYSKGYGYYGYGNDKKSSAREKSDEQTEDGQA